MSEKKEVVNVSLPKDVLKAAKIKAINLDFNFSQYVEELIVRDNK